MASSDPATLRKAVSRLYDAFRESTESVGNIASIDVSIRQHQTMSLVCRLTEDKPNGVTLKELAEAMKLAPATVSELVESLVKKNFLQRVQIQLVASLDELDDRTERRADLGEVQAVGAVLSADHDHGAALRGKGLCLLLPRGRSKAYCIRYFYICTSFF